MTIDELIFRLERYKDLYGGDKQVMLIIQDDAEFLIAEPNITQYDEETEMMVIAEMDLENEWELVDGELTLWDKIWNWFWGLFERSGKDE